MSKINQKVLISGADYFGVEELNPYEHKDSQPDVKKAIAEHALLEQSFEQVGIKVVKVAPPPNCQDGIYTANWGLCWHGKAVLSSLPNMRKDEEPYAKEVLSRLGYEVISPIGRFSGQGDCLTCGDYLFVGSNYRTDKEMHKFLADQYSCKVVGVETIPATDTFGQPIINKVTGWPDSYFYDLDLALAVITPELIAWCPQAFTQESRNAIEVLPLEKIEVSMSEAKEGFACNLVSSGEVVIMSSRAPELRSAIEKRGFKTITPEINELVKGGGYIRCCSLTLD
ncbi:MAG: dimethylarginine dimethylaminohydrolase family protein [Candidatus Saccharimonadales bacterium]